MFNWQLFLIGLCFGKGLSFKHQKSQFKYQILFYFAGLRLLAFNEGF